MNGLGQLGDRWQCCVDSSSATNRWSGERITVGVGAASRISTMTFGGIK